MNDILTYKEKVKRIIESHGGEVAIDFIPGIIKQPASLQASDLYFRPVALVFDGVKLIVNVSGSYSTLQQAKEYIKCLQSAISIIEEVNNDNT